MGRYRKTCKPNRKRNDIAIPLAINYPLTSMNEIESSISGFNRRDFLKGSSFAALMAMMGGVELVAQPAPAPAAEAAPIKKVKVAVIGLGTWGREILDQLGRIKQAEVAVICDNYAAMMRRSTSKAPGAAMVEDYKAVLANKDVQAVIIATGTHQHKDIALEAMKAGKHVYCEAPLAHTVEDAKAIALEAKNLVGKIFQPGLQFHSDPQRRFLLPFIRTGALGKSIMSRAQWNKKTSWRSASPNPEREKELNWRLNQATSPGLIGEVGIHALEQATWFLNLQPTAVTGFGSNILWKDDGRDIADTAEVVIECAGGFRMKYSASLASSFDSESELLYGTDATVLMRDSKAWMFKEVDAPLLGWEVYAKKENFYKESGIVLTTGGSKQANLGSSGEAAAPPPALLYALENFLGNCAEITAQVEDFTSTYGTADKKALAENLATIKFLRDAADATEGYAATVLAIKANEAVVKGTRLELKKELFELA